MAMVAAPPTQRPAPPAGSLQPPIRPACSPRRTIPPAGAPRRPAPPAGSPRRPVPPAGSPRHPKRTMIEVAGRTSPRKGGSSQPARNSSTGVSLPPLVSPRGSGDVCSGDADTITVQTEQEVPGQQILQSTSALRDEVVAGHPLIHSGNLWKLSKAPDAQKTLFKSWQRRAFSIVKHGGTLSLQCISEKMNGAQETLLDLQTVADLSEMAPITMECLSQENRVGLCNDLHGYALSAGSGRSRIFAAEDHVDEIPDTLHPFCISWKHPVDGVKSVVLAAESSSDLATWLNCARKVGLAPDPSATNTKEAVQAAPPGVAPTLLQTPSLIWASAKCSRTVPQSSSSRMALHLSGSLTSSACELVQERLEEISKRLKRSLNIPEYMLNRSKDDDSHPEGKQPLSPRPERSQLLPTLKLSPLSAKAEAVEKKLKREAKLKRIASAEVLSPKGQAVSTPRTLACSKALSSLSYIMQRQSSICSDACEDDSPRGRANRAALLEVPEVHSTAEFDLCLALARQYGLSTAQIKEQHRVFLELDLNNSGQLCRSEFEEAIRHHCRIPIDEDIPEHLLQRCWAQADRNASGSLDFEEYLLWSMSQEYAEEFIVVDPVQREVRKVARDNNFNLVDVEGVKDVFDQFDLDKNGSIDEGEFRQCVFVLLGASKPSDITEKQMKRYWAEIDTDINGEASLEEFVVWYFGMTVLG